ncbi:MAG: hypothetical protein ACTSQJ_10880 [Promethearchaeota archaeon]
MSFRKKNPLSCNDGWCPSIRLNVLGSNLFINPTSLISNKQAGWQILKPPWEMLSHHFEEINMCLRSPESNFIRHNYKITPQGTLICIHCGASIFNPFLKTKREVVFRRKIKLQLAKSEFFFYPNDILIYRMYWVKKGNNEWKRFPSPSYIGQTKGTVKERLFRSDGHIRLAFRRPSHLIHRLIRKDFSNESIARLKIRYEIIQVIPFQGDYNKISEISELREKAKRIKYYENITQELADEAEKFWIGFYHTQFAEFGGNYEEGGISGGRLGKTISFEKLGNRS